MSVLPDDVIRSIQGRLAAKRGERAESVAARLLRKEGWSCARTKSGPIDIIAAKGGFVLLLQIKSGSARVSAKEAKLVVKWGQDFNADAEIWMFRGRDLIKRRIFARK